MKTPAADDLEPLEPTPLDVVRRKAPAFSFPPPTSETFVFTGSDLSTVSSGRSEIHQFLVELDFWCTLYIS